MVVVNIRKEKKVIDAMPHNYHEHIIAFMYVTSRFRNLKLKYKKNV